MKTWVPVLALLLGALISPHLAHAACRTGGTTSEKLDCIVTPTFASRHLASTITIAKSRALSMHRSSTFLPITTATYSALNSQVAVRRSDRLRLAVWQCTYTPATDDDEDDASCTSTTKDIYLCSNSTSTRNQIFHLDSNPSGSCSTR